MTENNLLLIQLEEHACYSAVLTSTKCTDGQVLDTLAWAERDLLLAYPRCADANVFVHLNSASQVCKPAAPLLKVHLDRVLNISQEMHAEQCFRRGFHICRPDPGICSVAAGPALHCAVGAPGVQGHLAPHPHLHPAAAAARLAAHARVVRHARRHGCTGERFLLPQQWLSNGRLIVCLYAGMK